MHAFLWQELQSAPVHSSIQTNNTLQQLCMTERNVFMLRAFLVLRAFQVMHAFPVMRGFLVMCAFQAMRARFLVMCAFQVIRAFLVMCALITKPREDKHANMTSWIVKSILTIHDTDTILRFPPTVNIHVSEDSFRIKNRNVRQ